MHYIDARGPGPGAPIDRRSMAMHWTVALGIWLASQATDQQTVTPAGEQSQAQRARAVVERAIEAHGGMATLSQARIDRVRLRGTMKLGEREIPFAAETVTELPKGFRNQVTLAPDTPGKQVLVQLLHQGKPSLYLNGTPQTISPAQLDEFRETLLIQQAMRLVSLVRDKDFALDWAGKGMLNERPVEAILVRADGRRPLRMSFDLETGYLVRTSHTVLVEGKPLLQEETYGDFRKLGLYKRPVKMVTTRDGKPLIDAELVDVRYPEKISEAEFLAP